MIDVSHLGIRRSGGRDVQGAAALTLRYLVGTGILVMIASSLGFLYFSTTVPAWRTFQATQASIRNHGQCAADGHCTFGFAGKIAPGHVLDVREVCVEGMDYEKVLGALMSIAYDAADAEGGAIILGELSRSKTDASRLCLEPARTIGHVTSLKKVDCVRDCNRDFKVSVSGYVSRK